MRESKKSMSSNVSKRHDVAVRAGVSETTVSFVYSKKRYVSPELRDRVLEAAKELNYYPDIVAASLVRGRTNSIAVLTEDLVSPLQMEVIKTIQEAAFEAGYFVYVCGGTQNLDLYLRNIISRKVDGVFLSVSSSSVNNDALLDLLDRGISVLVTSFRGFPDDRVCGIELDFTAGMKCILEHLGSLGHRKIAYLSHCDEHGRDRRLPAFRRYMAEMFGVDNPLVEMGEPPYDSNIEVGSRLMDRLIARTDDFTAVVCTNDLMAYGAMLRLRNHGMSVPDRVSVVGIDDITFSQASSPPLTTLSHCSAEFGRRIFEILHDNIEGKDTVRRDVIVPKLIIRESTAPCKDKR